MNKLDTLLLKTEIESEIKELEGVRNDTEAYKAKVDGVTKLMDKKIEMEKLEIERQDKEKEYNLKMEQMKEDKLHRWIKHGLEVLAITVPTALAVWGTKTSIKFEKEGTFTTIMGRGFIQKLLPKK